MKSPSRTIRDAMARTGGNLLLEACKVAIGSLTEEDFRETLTVDGVDWDVYTRDMPPGRKLDAVTVALRMEDGRVLVGLFCPGRPNADAIRATLMETRQ